MGDTLSGTSTTTPEVVSLMTSNNLRFKPCVLNKLEFLGNDFSLPIIVDPMSHFVVVRPPTFIWLIRRHALISKLSADNCLVLPSGAIINVVIFL